MGLEVVTADYAGFPMAEEFIHGGREDLPVRAEGNAGHPLFMALGFSVELFDMLPRFAGVSE